MRFVCVAAISCIIVSMAGFCEEKVQLSEEPLSKERAAIYRTLLEQYARDRKADSPLYLADKTIPADTEDLKLSTDCVKGFALEETTAPGKIIHSLRPELVSGLKIVLEKPDKLASTVEENDPDNLVRNVRKYAPDEYEAKLKDSVGQAIAHGYWTVSEIVFDKNHTRAVVSIGFHCGMLCGFGTRIPFKKSGNKWKMGKECGGWIS